MRRVRREVHYAGSDDYRVRLTGACAASAETTYDVLADLPAHLTWAGEDQYRSFRLLTVDAPTGPAAPGVAFRSTGTIPMMSVTWDNRNTVTAADRPWVFAFTTEGSIDWSVARWYDLAPDGGPGSGTFHHRYELSPRPDGCEVVYSVEQTRFDNAPWGMRLPGMRIGTHRVMIPLWFRHGFVALLERAEERERAGTAQAA